jgi:hypothetical protein
VRVYSAVEIYRSPGQLEQYRYVWTCLCGLGWKDDWGVHVWDGNVERQGQEWGLRIYRAV